MFSVQIVLALLVTAMAGPIRKERAQSMDPVQSVEVVDNTADVTGSAADLQEFDAATVLISVGTITDGTHTPTVQEAADDGSGSPDTWSDVASADLVDSFDDLSSDEVQWVGYIGNKRHLRLKVAVSGATTGGDYDGVIIRDLKRKEPTQ